jgi:hypothetical protein
MAVNTTTYISNNTNVDFRNLIAFLKTIIPKNKSISIFLKKDRIVIGYYPDNASFADDPKPLPVNCVEKLKRKLNGYPYMVYAKMDDINRINGKKLRYTAIIPIRASDVNLESVDTLF